MRLVIAEKPSLARAICTALSREGEHFRSCEENEYYESENYYVVAQFGHLLELLMPEEYPENEGKRAPMPYFPRENKYSFKIKKSCEKRFKTIEKLVKKQEITEIIHCGDSDREGQLLVDLVLERIGNTKPVTRPQFKALTPGAIISAFKKRSNNNAFKVVHDEGYARMLFDYDYGINLSNYATAKAHAKPALNVGRVKGAIMNEIYNREMAIKNFKPEKYFKVISNCDGVKLTSKEKFKNEAEAEAYARKLQPGPTIVKEITTAPITKKRPKLFSQTKLQAMMNKKYGYSPDKTLKLAQSLYEKGLTTYPRTNTEYMTEAEVPLIEAIINRINAKGNLELRTDKSVFDDSKVDSHSAIIITAKRPDSLPEAEMNCYMTILNRFRAVFCKEPCVYNKTTVIVDNPVELFKISGETMVTPGWQTFEPPIRKKDAVEKGKDEKQKDTTGAGENDSINENQVLPPLKEGQVLSTDFKPSEKTTTPPPHYTVATLGAWMENPFKKELSNNAHSVNAMAENFEDNAEENDYSDDEDYKNIIEGLEIGTEATRADILKSLQDKQYISLKKNSYRIEPRGIFLVEACRDLGIDMSKEKTSAMGKMIKDIGKGRISLNEAIECEHEDIRKIVALNKECAQMQNIDTGLGKCPLCGKPVRESPKSYGCSGWKEGCKFNVWKEIASKKITAAQIKKLVETGKTNEIKGFTSKKGKKFDARLKLNTDKTGVEFEFVNHRSKGQS